MPNPLKVTFLPTPADFPKKSEPKGALNQRPVETIKLDDPQAFQKEIKQAEKSFKCERRKEIMIRVAAAIALLVALALVLAMGIPGLTLVPMITLFATGMAIAATNMIILLMLENDPLSMKPRCQMSELKGYQNTMQTEGFKKFARELPAALPREQLIKAIRLHRKADLRAELFKNRMEYVRYELNKATEWLKRLDEARKEIADFKKAVTV